MIENRSILWNGMELEHFLSLLDSGEEPIPDGLEKINGHWLYHGVLQENELINDGLLEARIDGNCFLLNGEYVLTQKIIQMIESGEINPPTGWNVRFGRWCYWANDVLTDETLLLYVTNFAQQNDVLFYLDKRTGKYTP